MTNKPNDEVTVPEIPVPFVRKPRSEQGPSPKFPPYPGLPSETGMTTAMVVSGKGGKKKPPAAQPAVPA